MAKRKSLLGYYPAKYHETAAGSYVSYYVENPYTGQMVRKRIKLNRIKGKRERMRYARQLMKELNRKLAGGWNPFIEQDAPRSYSLIKDAYEEYVGLKAKELRPESIRAIRGYVGRFVEWLSDTLEHSYVLNVRQEHLRNFLRYMYVERGVSERYVNNYVSFIRTFWYWLIENGYATANIAVGIRKLKEKPKKRTIIPPDELERIFSYLYEHDRWFLWICYLTYYTLLRPKEISQLRVRDIKLERRLVVVPAEVSKVGKQRRLTMPKRMYELGRELGISGYDSGLWVLGGKDLRPGSKHEDSRYIAKRWSRLRKVLDLPMEYQFYSLKDTGIVAMLRAGVSPDKVRDQAGHSSLEMTNKYIILAHDDADEQIMNLDY